MIEKQQNSLVEPFFSKQKTSPNFVRHLVFTKQTLNLNFSARQSFPFEMKAIQIYFTVNHNLCDKSNLVKILYEKQLSLRPDNNYLLHKKKYCLKTPFWKRKLSI